MIDGQIEQEYLGKAVMECSKPQDVDGLRASSPRVIGAGLALPKASAERLDCLVQTKAA